MPIPPDAFPDLDRELQSTRRVLERFPDAHAAWRPHEKSRPIGELAWHVAAIPLRGAEILTTDGVDMAAVRPSAPPTITAAAILQRFSDETARLRAALASTDAAALKGEWAMRAGDRVLVRDTRAMLMRYMVISHMIHHRAQLGVYYRLLGVPVPGVYGPSADEGI
jgi:uncharacterized damage-inducible protein DinB